MTLDREKRANAGVLSAGAIVCGMGALAARRPDAGAVWIALAVGIIGLATPIPAPGTNRAQAPWALAVGVGAIVIVALGAPSLVPVARAGVGADLVAGVGEEAFFRRLVHGWLERWHPAAAIALGAAAFSLVHVPLYGWRVAGIDAAAGALFGWQRYASGTWLVPAGTHALANVAARW